MTIKLGDKQRKFTSCIGKLIIFAYEDGYELSFGDAYRDPRVPYGHPKSCHRHRLAVDFNLFKEGKYLTETDDHLVLVEYWETLHPLARWGGRFGDGNHYSFEHQGIK